MSRRGMRLLPLLIVMPMLAALGACATVGQSKTAKPPSDVSCSLFTAISYAQLDLAQRAIALAEGRPVQDEGNVADSDDTVRQIEAHNAKFDTVCGNPLAPPG